MSRKSQDFYQKQIAQYRIAYQKMQQIADEARAKAEIYRRTLLYRENEAQDAYGRYVAALETYAAQVKP